MLNVTLNNVKYPVLPRHVFCKSMLFDEFCSQWSRLYTTQFILPQLSYHVLLPVQSRQVIVSVC